MFSNFFKSSTIKNLSPLYINCTRLLNSQKEYRETHSKSTDEESLKIETHLFDNSSINHQPVTKEELLIKNKRKSKKNEPNSIISRPKQHPSFKKTRLERELESKVIHDSELGLEFTKLSLNDPRLTTLLITTRSKKRRDKERLIVIEGRRLILEALECGLKLDTIIFSQKDQLANIKEQIAKEKNISNAKIYKVPHHDLKTWSTLTTPPGIMAVFHRPPPHNILTKSSAVTSPLPITVVCDNIREPNNLGSIIRTCAALPCLQIVVTRGCCDPWESKALRGGCGGHFRIPIRDDVDWEDIPLMIPPEVADNCCIFLAENNLKKLHSKSTIVNYTEIENIGSHNVVVIGGESHGVSQDAYKFMETVGQRGKCLYIPLAKGIDSLNVASALTLILYELRKNFIKSDLIKEVK